MLRYRYIHGAILATFSVDLWAAQQPSSSLRQARLVTLVIDAIQHSYMFKSPLM